MTDEPWTDDACSLVDAFRRGDRSPREEVAATLAAISASTLNSFSFVDGERALEAAEHLGVAGALGVDQLDRTGPLQQEVLGQVDLAHPAGAELHLNLVRTEACTGSQGQRAARLYPAQGLSL